MLQVVCCYIALTCLLKTNITLRKLSPQYFQSEPDQTLIELSGAAKPVGSRNFSLLETDYDFSDTDRLLDGLLDRSYAQRLVEEDISLSETFYSEYLAGVHDGLHTPRRVIVVTDVATFSAGFMFATYLEMMGATVVGSTPSQNMTHMGETVHFELANSKLSGDISRSLLILDSTRLDTHGPDQMLTPDYELTYEKLKEYQFARDSAVYYAIDLLEDMAGHLPD